MNCDFVCLFVYVYQLLEAQADYHRRSLAALEATIPTIQLQQGEQNDIKHAFIKSANNIIEHNICMHSSLNPNVVLELVFVNTFYSTQAALYSRNVAWLVRLHLSLIVQIK